MSTPVYLPDAVLSAQQLYQPIIEEQRPDLTVREQLEAFAERLLQAHKDQHPAAQVEISNWFSPLIGKEEEEVFSTLFTYDNALETVARAHGFTNWFEVEEKGNQPFDPVFEAAVDALLAGNLDELKLMIHQYPTLLHERSPYGHGATLFHYIGSNGVETRRQQVPMNLPEITRFLLAAGADQHATARLYEEDMDTLSLLVTSAHPYDAGIAEEMEAILSGT